MARSRRPSLVRWRRLQLVKHLLENDVIHAGDVAFDARARIDCIDADPVALRAVVATGEPFRTDGCPGNDGSPACNRPFGSYRPGEPFRDYPFPPEPADLRRIERELRLDEILPAAPAHHLSWRGLSARALRGAP